MRTLIGLRVRIGLACAVLICAISLTLSPARAAPYAAMVMDARSGEVLHSRNADTRLHPASLTKMMTLYIVFEAVRLGEISLDTEVRISRHAASEPPSKLGLKAGQRIKLRYLIRAAAVKSANDAATALGEAISGSEAAFARRMNRTAKALGMSRTTFKNAHGLTESGHLSTARDMTVMGRRLFYDYPDYYNLFSRRTTHAGVKEVANTNRRFLAAYRGADGIKTGYTRAAGFNLVASAERGPVRILATVYGGNSTATRNAEVARLLDLGFSRARRQVAVNRPALPTYPVDNSAPAGKIVRVHLAVKRSPRPVLRPDASPAPDEALIAAIETNVEDAITSAVAEAALTETIVTTPSEPMRAAGMTALPNAVRHAPSRPATTVAAAEAEAAPTTLAEIAPAPAQTPQAAVTVAPAEPAPLEIVTRMSTSGERHWGIAVGNYTSRFAAEKVLLTTALMEIGTLDDALRKVVPRSEGYDATFVGLSRERAALACRRLIARDMDCETIGPS